MGLCGYQGMNCPASWSSHSSTRALLRPTPPRLLRCPLVPMNPVSAAPGFKLENVYVMAGVPAVFEAMVASVLPTLTGGAPLISATHRIERGEGDIAGPLGELAHSYPNLSIGSYPFQKDGKYGAHIVIRGNDQAEVDAAMAKLAQVFP